MNDNAVFLFFGLIIGYVIMYVSSKIIVFHGPNSNYIRKRIYHNNNMRYRFNPVVIKKNNKFRKFR